MKNAICRLLPDHLPDARKMVKLGFVRQAAVVDMSHRYQAKPLRSQFVISIRDQHAIGFL